MTNSSNFPNRPFRLEVRSSTNWQDVNSNRSSVHTELWMVKNAYSPTISGGGSSYELWANGSIVASSPNFSFDFTNSDSLRIAAVDYLVDHDADGAKWFDTLGKCTADILGYTEVPERVTLSTIARASTASFVGGPAFDAGAAVTVATNRAVSTFTHVLEASFGGRKATIGTGVGASMSWTPPLGWLDQIPNAVQGAGSLLVGTYNGSDPNAIGYRTTAFTLRAPATVVPTVSAVTIADGNPDVSSKVGAFVQGLSSATGTVTAAGAYGSTITQKSVTIGTTSAAEGVQIPLTASGSVPVVGVVTDSRGRVASSAGSITVLAYDVPKITAANVQRATSGGAPADNGTYLRVDLNAAVSSLVNGTEKNALTITVQTREHGTGPWTTRNTITPGLAHNGFFLVSGGGIFDAAKSYDVRITAADKFLTAVQDIPVGTERVIADFGPGGMGVNKRYTQGGLDVAGDVFTDSEFRHRGGNPVEPVGVIHMFGGSTAPTGFLLCDGTAVSRTTYAALFATIGTAYGVGNGSSTFNLPDMRGRGPMGKDSTTDFDALGKTGGEKAHLLTVAEMPAHTHGPPSGNAYLTQPQNSTASGGGGLYAAAQQSSATASAGGGGTHNVLDPYVTLNFIIKAL